MLEQHILVVDDDPDALKLVSMRLSGQGYSVSQEETGQAALDEARRRTPDLIMLSITCLRMDTESLAEGCAAALGQRGLEVVYAPIEDPDPLPPSVGGIHWRPVYSLSPDDVEQLIHIHSQQHDCLVLDLTQGLDDTGMACVEHATCIIIVTATYRESLASAHQMSNTLDAAGVQQERLIAVLVPPEVNPTALNLEAIQRGLGVGEVMVLNDQSTYETLTASVVQRA